MRSPVRAEEQVGAGRWSEVGEGRGMEDRRGGLGWETWFLICCVISSSEMTCGRW